MTKDEEIQLLKERIKRLEKSETEHKQAEFQKETALEALQESEEKFRTVADFTYDWEYWVNPQGKFIYVSPSCERITGYNSIEFLQNPKLLFSIVHSDDVNIVKNHKHKVFGTGEIDPIEFCIITKSGEDRWIGHICQTVYDSNGVKIGQRGSNRDITKRKQAEGALRESEEKFRDMSNLLPQVVYEIDIYGNLTFVNKQAFDFFGYSQEEYKKGINVLQTLIPEDRDRAKENIQNALYGKDVGNSEYTALRKDGSTFPILIYSSAILKDNKPVGLRGIIVDITERKKAEEKLQKEMNFNKTLLQASPAFFVAISNEGKTIMANNSMLKALGYKQEEIVGKDYMTTFVPERDHEMLSKVFERLVQKKEPTLNENYIMTKNGKELLVEWHGRPVFKENGEYDFFFGVGMDITERKKAEEKLKEANTIINKSSSIAFTWKNEEGWPVEYVSENVEYLFRYTAKDFTSGKVNYAQCVHPKDLKRVTQEVMDANNKEDKEEFVHEPYRIVSKDGKERIVSDWTFLVRDEKDNITHYKGIITDITERMKAEEEINKLKDELEIKVAEQTKELKVRVSELERFYEATIDREFRMKELRDEIEKLKSRG